MNSSLTRMALNRPVAVLMLCITLLGLGGIAWLKLPLTFLPPADNPFVVCVFPYPGAAPLQVERQVAIPVEGEFNTIPGLTRIETHSSSGTCQVTMQFGADADMTAVIGEIRDRIERLKLELPTDVERVLIQKFRLDSFPVMMAGMFSSGDREQFAHYMRTVVQPRLQRINGVASIEVFSPISPREAVVEFDQNTLDSLNLDLSELIQRLRTGGENLSLGVLNEDAARYLVRYEGEYRGLEDIADLPIGKRGLRMGDVARIRYTPREQAMRVKLDNNDGVMLLIHKESQANTVDTCRAVRAELEAMLKLPMFQDARLFIFLDQAEIIVKVLNSLLMQGVYGGLMAIGVMFIFLHRLLPTLLVAASIPLSLVFAMILMYFAGMTLNIVTLVSMIVAIGMLVDNAIVVVENIMRKHGQGAPIAEAVRQGAQEVGLAIFAATATTWVVFVPMYFLDAGQMAVFMQQFGGPLFASLGGSLIIALTLVPLAMTALLRLPQIAPFRKQPAKTDAKRATLAQRALQGCVNAYGALLGICLRRRLEFLLLIAAFLALSIAYPMKQVGMRALPNMDLRQLTVDVKFDAQVGMQQVADVFVRLEEELNALRDALHIKNILSYHDPEGGSFSIYLQEENDLPKASAFHATEDVVKILSQKLPRNIPGAEITVSAAGAGEMGDNRKLTLMLRGENTSVLKEYVQVLAEAMRRVQGLQDVQVDAEKARPEVQVRIDAPRAHHAGITPMMIAQTIDAALRGMRLGYLKQVGREIPIWAQYREEDRRSQANLEQIKINGNNAALIPLNQLTQYEMAPSPESIHRVNGQNMMAITAAMTHANLLEIRRELEAILAHTKLPPGCSLGFGEDIEEAQKSIMHFTMTVLMSILLVYLVMCALFESMLLPLSVMTTVPLALVGSVWMLFFTQTPFDSISLIGCILLAGVIVNNGIVIVDHIHRVRAEHTARNHAIVQAGMDRFRPVNMTAITTILGLAPIAMTATGGASTFAGLGRTLIGGMLLGTVLTLFVVPVFYSVLDDLSLWARDFWGSLPRKR